MAFLKDLVVNGPVRTIGTLFATKVQTGDLKVEGTIVVKSITDYGNTLPSTSGATEGQIFFKIV